MKIVVDTNQDITQLFKILSENIRLYDETAACFLENYIVISANSVKIKKIIARTLAGYITDVFERKLLHDHIRAFELLKSDEQEIVESIVSNNELKQKRLQILEKELLLQLSSGHVNIDGLVAFRLDEYKKELQFTAEYFIDELSAQKSYDEFIGLMKYFAEIQTPITDTVVLSENSGEYKLTDSSGKPILLKFDEEFADDLAPIGLSQEDLLISNLMAAMPKKIIFDNVNTDTPVINTISRIFEGRIST